MGGTEVHILDTCATVQSIIEGEHSAADLKQRLMECKALLQSDHLFTPDFDAGGEKMTRASLAS